MAELKTEGTQVVLYGDKDTVYARFNSGVNVSGLIGAVGATNAADYGATGNGSTDDTASLQAAITATPNGGTLWIPDGTYKVSSSLNVTRGISIRGVNGGPGDVGSSGAHVSFQASSGLGATPLLNITPGSLVHHCQFENFNIDLSSATGATGIYATNIDNSRFLGIKVRDGATGIQLDNVQLTTLRDMMCFNQRTRGFYSSHASNVDIRFDNCIYEQTVGASWAATAAWDISNGASFIMNACEALRSPAGSGNWLSYGVNVTSPAATTWLFMTNCWFDAVSDGTGANSANSTGLNLTTSVINVRASNCFFSASSSAGQKQRVVRINGGSDHQFVNCTFGGSGVEFATGNASRCGFANCNFVQQFGDAAVSFTGGAAPTSLSFRGNTLQGTAGIVASAADAATFLAATNGASSGA